MVHGSCPSYVFMNGNFCNCSRSGFKRKLVSWINYALNIDFWLQIWPPITFAYVEKKNDMHIFHMTCHLCASFERNRILQVREMTYYGQMEAHCNSHTLWGTKNAFAGQILFPFLNIVISAWHRNITIIFVFKISIDKYWIKLFC